MRILPFLVLLTASSVLAVAQDYCSLIVQVVNPYGIAVSGVPVAVEEGNGRIESKTTEGGEARFCDLGIYGVTIRAGSACNQVVVRNTPLTWTRTRNVKITYDRAPCLEDGPPPVLLCSILFRFKDEDGKWVSEVGFTPSIKRSPQLRTDNSGRAMIRMAKGERLHVTAEHAGYLPEVIDRECDNSLDGVERLITLRKAR